MNLIRGWVETQNYTEQDNNLTTRSLMDGNPNVNRALSALLKELEHIKDLTSIADGYRAVAHDLSASVEEYHKLNSSHIAQLCQLSEDAAKASSESIYLAQEQFSTSLSRIEAICNSLSIQEIIDRLDVQKGDTETYSQCIIGDLKIVAHQQSKTIDRIDQSDLTLSKDIISAVKSISQEINTLRDSANQIIKDSSDNNRQILSDQISKIENRIVDLEVKSFELLRKHSSDIAEHQNCVIAYLKEHNENLSKELQSIQSNISYANIKIQTLKKLGIATILGLIIVAGTVIISICL